MLYSCLHPLGRYAPFFALEVDLLPRSAPGLAGADRVEYQEAETQLGGCRGLGRLHSFQRCPDLLVGQRPEVCLHLRHRGQRTVDGFPRRVGLHEAVGHGPPQARPHPLTHAPSRLRPGRPYRSEDAQHIPSVYPVQGCVAEGRHGVPLQGLNPARAMPGVAPAGCIRLVDGMGGFSEGRQRRGPLLGQRVAPLCDGGPGLRRLLSGSGQAHGGKPSQSAIAPPSVDGDAQDPGLVSRPTDVEVQASAVGVPPRLPEGLDPRR